MEKPAVYNYAGPELVVLPRLQGDGMDNEVLRQQELSPSTQRKLLSRHSNLKDAHRAATIATSQNAAFVPHEPVKGAVSSSQPASSSRQMAHNLPPTSQKPPSRPPANNRIAPPPKIVAPPGLRQPQQFPYSHRTVENSPPKNSTKHNSVNPKAASPPNVTDKEKINPNVSPPPEIKSTVTVSNKSPLMRASNVEVIRSVKVPVYEAPGHLHIDTYKSIQNHQQQKKSSPSSTPPQMSPSASTVINIPQSPENQKDLVVAQHTSVQVEDERRVEGEPQTFIESLQKQIGDLTSQLEVQTKVNADLKKMLVASMGEDLHYRVEALVRTKAQMAAEMGGYSDMLQKGDEEVDKLSIQADMWHSKYMATRVLLEKVQQEQSITHELWEQCRSSLTQLLHERHTIKDSLILAFNQLQQLKSALGPHHRGKKVTPPAGVLDLAQATYELSDSVRFSLLGAIPSEPNVLDVSTLTSPGELFAYQVLYTASHTPCLDPAKPHTCPILAAPDSTEKYTRFNPQARYDNLTINCCGKCKGDLHVV